MTLSQICFDVHTELKTFIPNIKRSQVYELLSARLGYYTYKHFCQDAVLLTGSGHKYFDNNHSELLKKRIQDLNLTASTEQLYKIDSLVDSKIAQQQIYAPRIKDFLQKFLESINFGQGFISLEDKILYQDLNDTCFSKKPHLNAIILNLFILSKIKPDHSFSIDSKKQKIIKQSLSVFGRSKVLPYLIIFHLVQKDNKDDLDLIKGFLDENGLRDVIDDYSWQRDFIKLHAWHKLALKLGYNDILDFKESHAYAIPSSYGGDFYDSDDGEWYDIVEYGGRDLIKLPKLNNLSLNQAEKLANEFYQIYQDTQKAIAYASENFTFAGFQGLVEDYYYWYDEELGDFYDEDFSEEYYDDFWEDEE